MKQFPAVFAVFGSLFVRSILSQTVKCSPGLNRCDLEAWSKWSSCSKTCGNGTRIRSRYLCCSLKESFDDCLAGCNVSSDKLLDSAPCSFVCPAGNCTFQRIENTGIEATDYQKLYESKLGNLINPPLHFSSTESFCEHSCRDGDLNNGLFCWVYSYSVKDKCFLHFFNKPLSVVHPELQGQSLGESIFIKHCTKSAECQSIKADIVFVVDSSGSFGSENFKKIKVFLQELLNKLDIDTDMTRVGLLVFYDKARWVFRIGDLNSKTDMFKAIQRLQYLGGDRLTSDALEKVRLEGFTNNRTGVPMIAVVITDGISKHPLLTRYQAKSLRKENVHIYAIGVGNETNTDEIFHLASIPEQEHMYEFNSFTLLDASAISLPVKYVNCKATVPSGCVDLSPDCASYPRDSCTDYEPNARKNCARTCGYCPGFLLVEPECKDGIENCEQYGISMCYTPTQYDWVDFHCRKFCGFCGNKTDLFVTTTTPIISTVSSCTDNLECSSYNANLCTNPTYASWARQNCRKYCGFCFNYYHVTSTYVNQIQCPSWDLPEQCTLEYKAGQCCPFPKCPGLRLTIKRHL